MIYQANNRQYRALEGLAHWCAEYYYTLERLGADDAEMPAIRKDMSFCMDRCDALGVPYWAQNAALAWAEFLSTLSLRRATAKVHKTVGHFCAYETNFMGIASSC